MFLLGGFVLEIVVVLFSPYGFSGERFGRDLPPVSWVALFIWVLAWVAREKGASWKWLFAACFAAFLLSSLVSTLIAALVSHSSFSIAEPLLMLARAAIFTGIFWGMTFKRKLNA